MKPEENKPAGGAIKPQVRDQLVVKAYTRRLQI